MIFNILASAGIQKDKAMSVRRCALFGDWTVSYIFIFYILCYKLNGVYHYPQK